jgi:hypothetical protein
MDTNIDETEPTGGQEQPIIIDPTNEQPTIPFSTEPSTFQFSAGSSFLRPPLDDIDFQPEGPSSQATSSSTQSKADKARARTAKAREARAKKAAEKKANSDDTSNKSARMSDLVEEANQELLESELSSELDEVNMRDLESQLEAHRNDQDFQPSSPAESIAGSTAESTAEEPENRKRKQPHSDDYSLNIQDERTRRRQRARNTRTPTQSSRQ